MQIQKNISLKPYNTFGIDVPAEYFIAIDKPEQLQELSASGETKYILGGGSNILLTQPVEGLVIFNKLKGISILRQDESYVWLNVCSGELWHSLVMYAIDNGWSGIENLALIPGSVGAAPIQNIGAYGVEVKDTIVSVTAWHWGDRKHVTYSNADCHFGYRDSVFKHELKNKVFITSVQFRLNKNPVYNTTYGAIGQELNNMGVTKISAKTIADAVINIRTSKLPDPKKIGNAGSFFKNPTIDAAHFELLQTNYPLVPHYPSGDEAVKIPAGWLIEQCGWKGYRKDDAGVHEKQALVLVNYAQATGNEIWQLSDDILTSVKEKFGISLEREVQVW